LQAINKGLNLRARVQGHHAAVQLRQIRFGLIYEVFTLKRKLSTVISEFMGARARML